MKHLSSSQASTQVGLHVLQPHLVPSRCCLMKSDARQQILAYKCKDTERLWEYRVARTPGGRGGMKPGSAEGKRLGALPWRSRLVYISGCGPPPGCLLPHGTVLGTAYLQGLKE